MRSKRKAKRFHEMTERAEVTKIEKAEAKGFFWVNVDAGNYDGMAFATLLVPRAIAQGLRIGQEASLAIEFLDAPHGTDELAGRKLETA